MGPSHLLRRPLAVQFLQSSFLCVLEVFSLSLVVVPPLRDLFFFCSFDRWKCLPWRQIFMVPPRSPCNVLVVLNS
jgi:hypothetical protein